MNRSDEGRIKQLTSPYSPQHPPQLPLEFGDFLSILWRVDRHAAQESMAQYYTQCARAIAQSFQFDQKSLGRMVRSTPPGQLYESLSNVPFRVTGRLLDASARKDAIRQLARLRSDVLSIGAYEHDWIVGWPGSGVLDTELRERIFATLFTALRSQYANFGRLLLVIDIVLHELLLGQRAISEVSLGTLIDQFGYRDPEDPDVRALFVSGRRRA
jgi:hypothetical protein